MNTLASPAYSHDKLTEMLLNMPFISSRLIAFKVIWLCFLQPRQKRCDQLIILLSGTAKCLQVPKDRRQDTQDSKPSSETTLLSQSEGLEDASNQTCKYKSLQNRIFTQLISTYLWDVVAG
jgi:hypothetical protein